MKKMTISKTVVETPSVFNYNSNIFRSVTIENEPWFIAKDVCEVLTISNSRDAILKLDEDEKLMSVLPRLNQNRKMQLVSESGLFHLIFRSNKPEAKQFRKWVTSEVLPTIRKEGSYAIANSQEKLLEQRKLTLQADRVNMQKRIRRINTELKAIYTIATPCRRCGKILNGKAAMSMHVKVMHSGKKKLFGKPIAK